MCRSPKITMKTASVRRQILHPERKHISKFKQISCYDSILVFYWLRSGENYIYLAYGILKVRWSRRDYVDRVCFSNKVVDHFANNFFVYLLEWMRNSKRWRVYLSKINILKINCVSARIFSNTKSIITTYTSIFHQKMCIVH